MLFWGCAQPQIPSDLTRDDELGTLGEVLTLADMNAVAFEWQRLDDPIVAGYLLYRGGPEGNLTRIGGVPNRFATHYTDDDGLIPGLPYIYRLSYYTTDGRESRPTPNVSVRTLPAPPPVSFVQSVPGLPRMGKLVFRPHPSERISHYTIERRDLKDRNWRQVGRLQGRLHAEYIDTGLADEMEYEYRIIAHTHDGIATAPSDIVITATRALPPTPTGLEASTDQPRTIQIRWDRLADDEAGRYRLYASSRYRSGFNRIAELEAVSGATETLKEDGHERFYKITFVDRDGLESPLAERPVRGQTLQKPKAPALKALLYQGQSVEIRWENRDERVVSYEVQRHRVSGPLLRDETIWRVNETSYTDQSTQAGTAYQYRVIGIDEHGIRSEPSEHMRITVEASGVN